MKSIENCLEIVSIAFRKGLKLFCPCIYYAIFSNQDECKVLKKICGLLYGILLGLMFYEMILIDLDFTEYSAMIMGLIMCLILGFGIALSRQIRCIALLALPNLGGKAGRAALKAFVIAYIIAGPVSNMANNGREVVRVFACTTSFTFNLTKTRFQLMYKPFQEAIFGMKAETNEIKDTVRSIRDVTAPITGELEGEAEMKKMKEENDYLDELQNDSKRSEEIDKKYNTTGENVEAERFKKNYLKKIETRCQDQLTKAGRKCREMFGRAYDSCYETVTWIAAWILCWPMKLTFVCNIVEAIGGTKTCDPAQDVDPGFGEGYAYLKNSGKKLTQNFKDIKLQYKIGKIKQLQDIRDAADSAKRVIHEVDTRKQILDAFLRIFKRVLAFVFLKVIVDSQDYHDSYLRNIEFDNIYITKYFRKIDARRKIQEKHTLLPLKKIEKLKMVDPYSIKPLKKEREALVGQTVRLLLEIIATTVFILLDKIFYEILDIIRRHAKINYLQIGHHDMTIDVKGTGFIASVLRKLVRKFNFKKRIKIARSNEHCLPQPSSTSLYYIIKIYGYYLLVWIMLLNQAYILRMRRIICAFFYRKREKKRVLFLYNEALKRRVGYFRHMKQKVENMVREQRLEENLNFFTILRIKYPKCCNWLRIFAAARRKCIICQDPEPCRKKNIAGNFTKCPTPTCYVVYCLECWNDLNQTCYACAVDEEAGTDTEEYENSDSGVADSD